MTFYFEGDEFFSALRRDLTEAKQNIDLEMYYLASDPLGWEFARILAQKAHQGLPVRLIVDGIGCRGTSVKIFDFLTDEGVGVVIFNPFFPFPRNLRRRTHRKFAVIDEKIFFIGGLNIAGEYSQSQTGARAWRDSAVRVEDPKISRELTQLFEETWEGKIRSLRHYFEKGRKRPPWRMGGLHLIPNFGWRRKSLIREEFLAGIIHAQSQVFITNPYFVPGHGILRALKRAARRGVDVRLLTAGVSDVPIVQWASRATYGTLLKAGVRIFEYQNRVLHGKTALIDGEWFTIGTSNIDHNSFFHNFEVNLFGKDSAAGASLARQFEEDLVHSREILAESWSQRPWYAKIWAKFFYLFRPWL